MSKKGFFEGVVESIAKSIQMKGIIEASKDESGKVDFAKATGISMGLGNTSTEDMLLFGGMLGAEGAFDDKNSNENDYDLPFDDDVTSNHNDIEYLERRLDECNDLLTSFENLEDDLQDLKQSLVEDVFYVAVQVGMVPEEENERILEELKDINEKLRNTVHMIEERSEISESLKESKAELEDALQRVRGY